MRRLIAAIRDNDERQVEEAVLQLAGTRKIFAPLALAAGAFVMLFSGLRLLVTNWKLMLVQALPAMWLWAATYDLKAKVLRGQPFHDIRGPVVLVLFAAVVLITIAAFWLNAAFAFAISQPGPPDLRAGFGQAASTSGRSPAGAPASAWRSRLHGRGAGAMAGWGRQAPGPGRGPGWRSRG